MRCLNSWQLMVMSTAYPHSGLTCVSASRLVDVPCWKKVFVILLKMTHLFRISKDHEHCCFQWLDINSRSTYTVSIRLCVLTLYRLTCRILNYTICLWADEGRVGPLTLSSHILWWWVWVQIANINLVSHYIAAGTVISQLLARVDMQPPRIIQLGLF